MRDIQIGRTPPILTEKRWNKGVLEVHFLTGSRHLVDFLYAAKSLLVNYNGRTSINVHADSSITAGGLARIKKHFPNAYVTTREMRDAIVVPILQRQNLKKCLSFREANVFATKLIDLVLISEADRFFYMDTDCLIFKPLERLRAFAEHVQPKSVGSRDCACSYCLAPAEIEKHWGLQVSEKINAGFYAVVRSALDLDLVETWLSTPGFNMKSHFAEQTILAALLTYDRCDFFSDNECDVGRRLGERNAQCVHYCGHYLSPIRIAMRQIGQQIALRQVQAMEILNR